MDWIKPEFDAQRVNSAGKALLAAIYSDHGLWSFAEWERYVDHLEVINNWRGSHAYPLNTFQVNLRATSRRFDVGAPLIAQRIKRLTSIGHKLDRFRSMKLSQMQDLGGCRAILTNVGVVRRVKNYYLSESAIKHELVSVDDYITEPKASGYRGVHLVYRYFSDKSKTAYNGLKIELQIRSRYEHAWATAVETVGMFSGQALKSSLGSTDWQRFFALMSSAIAMRERSHVVPDTPSIRRDLVGELAHYATALNVEGRLREYGRALNSITGSGARNKSAQFYLLELDPKNATLSVSGFSSGQREEADKRYAEAELKQQQKPGTDAVLVSVESVNALSRAFPNYFADTRLFVELLTQTLQGQSRGIVVPDRQLDLLIE